MGSTRLSEWLHILASLGVLVGLIFLALEIRQANRIAIATTEITVREAYGSSNENIYTNPEIAALLAKARSTDVEFSDAEQEMLFYFISRMMNTWRGIEKAYINEMVARETFNTAIEDMKWTVETYPISRSILKRWVETYPSASESELIQEVIQLLEER